MSREFSRPNLQVAAQTAGTFIRYAFYAIGLLTFSVIGLVALWIWNRLPSSPERMKVDPAFQIAAKDLARRPLYRKAENQSYGWVESLQYGQLYDRDVDMTVLMIVPKEAYQTLTRNYFSEVSSLRPIAGRSRSTSAFYDLETRFGSVRASEFMINSDGRNKLCISYLSRFDSPVFYLKGWYCEANGARPSFSAVACVLDQLTLKGDLPSAEATAFINERMRRPPKCSAEPVSQTTDTGQRQQPLKRLIR
jgi:hypothetical protein